MQFDTSLNDHDHHCKSQLYEKTKKVSCAYFLANFSVDLDEMWCAAMTCCLVEADANIILHDQYSKERILQRLVSEICL